MATVKEITGGTGDVNPQILTVSVTQTAADTRTEVEVPIPLARFQTRKGKSIVMEVLSVEYILTDLVTPGGAVSVNAQLATAPGTTTTVNPTVFSAYRVDGIFATAVGVAYIPLTKRDVLNDGAGHGYLVATDNIFAVVQSQNTALANQMVFKIFYRFKEVNLEEYLGIVAGQQ